PVVPFDDDVSDHSLAVLFDVERDICQRGARIAGDPIADDDLIEAVAAVELLERGEGFIDELRSVIFAGCQTNRLQKSLFGEMPIAGESQIAYFEQRSFFNGYDHLA